MRDHRHHAVLPVRWWSVPGDGPDLAAPLHASPLQWRWPKEPAQQRTVGQGMRLSRRQTGL
ncbi:hypothetical protein H7H82_19670 [Mycobacterium heidelbergense]|uniref:hypothetical protein n=1 Tax=Mycobacterium heidelbergense TaxID=53376 RepID=UPI001153246F|nr:hypothetical protein [Mycobacterium heidelbergense]MCV7052783.1 hypothetical protein [Mycobacterium heidelbergense]